MAEYSEVTPWRQAVAGDFVRLTGAGLSARRQELYGGKVVRVTGNTTADYVFFEMVEDDLEASNVEGKRETKLYNQETRFAVVVLKGDYCECGKHLNELGRCINVFCAVAQDQATGVYISF